MPFQMAASEVVLSRENMCSWYVLFKDASRSVGGRQSIYCRTRRAATACAQHPLRVARAAGAEIGLQQRELDEVELGTAAAEAFELADNRLKRVDRDREVTLLERSKTA